MLKRYTCTIGVLSLLLLSACTATQQKRDALPAAEVLQNAAQKSADLDSARYEASGSFSLLHTNGESTEGNYVFKGVLQESGEKIAMTIGFDAKQGLADLQASIDVVVTGPDDIFVRANNWSGVIAQKLFRQDLLEQFMGKWWILPRDESSVSPVQVTPDPRLLQAQAEVVSITSERGFASVRGNECYRYDVEIDQEKLFTYLAQLARSRGEEIEEEKLRADLEGIDAKGQLWIDADTFIIHKLQWTFTTPISSGAQSLSTSVMIDIFDHNSADPVIPPADAVQFRSMQFLDAPLPPLEIKPIDPKTLEDDILKKLFDEGTVNPYSNQPIQ